MELLVFVFEGEDGFKLELFIYLLLVGMMEVEDVVMDGVGRCWLLVVN